MNDDSATSTSDRILEIVAVLLLAVSTLGTAWCGYQSSQWNGVQTDLSRQSSDERVEANRQFGLATQKVAYDSTLVAEYAQAVRTGDTKLQQFYRDALIRPEFLPQLDAWQDDIQAGQKVNIFSDPVYLKTQFQQYNDAAAKAEDANVASQAAGNTADDYVLITILLAVALFFAGVTSSFRYKPARALLIVMALGTIAVAASRLVDLPVA